MPQFEVFSSEIEKDIGKLQSNLELLIRNSPSPIQTG